MTGPVITVIRVGYYLPMSQEVLDDGVEWAWLICRGLPGAERKAIAARKRMLELNWGEGSVGPRGPLP